MGFVQSEVKISEQPSGSGKFYPSQGVTIGRSIVIFLRAKLLVEPNIGSSPSQLPLNFIGIQLDHENIGVELLFSPDLHQL